jgi:GxxExxY protein
MGNDLEPTQSAQSAQRLNSISGAVIGAAVEVHRHLGPGLLESAYEACLAHELIAGGFAIERQKPLPVFYKGQRLDVGYRLDLVVEKLVVVEIKSIERLERVHFSQVLSYLRLTGCRLGLLINFNVPKLVEGVRRVANALPRE